MENEAELQKLWIVEWSFRGRNKWSPVDCTPYRAVSEAESYPKRRGFDYRIVEYVEAARASESSPPTMQPYIPVTELRHLAWVLVHDGLEPEDGFGGCSCDTCSLLRDCMKAVRQM